jgi:protein required for attachment to host cells
MRKAKVAAGDWVVVCDGRKAVILANEGDAAFPNLRHAETHEHADPPTHAQGTDSPGRVQASAGGRRSAVEQTDWHDLAERKFLRALASRLDEALRTGAAAAFIVVAPPRALGMLRPCYSPAVRKAIRAELAKDYVRVPMSQLESRLLTELGRVDQRARP